MSHSNIVHTPNHPNDAMEILEVNASPVSQKAASPSDSHSRSSAIADFYETPTFTDPFGKTMSGKICSIGTDWSRNVWPYLAGEDKGFSNKYVLNKVRVQETGADADLILTYAKLA